MSLPTNNEPPKPFDPNVAIQEDIAEEYRLVAHDRIQTQVEILQKNLDEIEFDPDNPTHSYLRNRFLGATLAAHMFKDRPPSLYGTGDSNKKDVPPAPPSMALRIDGGTDFVDADGAARFDKGLDPEPHQILASTLPIRSAEPAAVRQPGFSIPVSQPAKRQIIID